MPENILSCAQLFLKKKIRKERAKIKKKAITNRVKEVSFPISDGMDPLNELSSMRLYQNKIK